MILAGVLPHLGTDHHTPVLGETASATFSSDRTYRYLLTRRWDRDLPLACFVMLNPSTADAFVEDATSRRCTTFARSWNAGGLILVNLFALRSTSPRALYSHEDPVGPDNDAVLSWVLSGDHAPVGPVVAAWGTHGHHLGRGEQVARFIHDRTHRPLCLGLTRDGHPRHPLYLSNGTTAVELPKPAEVAR